MRKPLYVCLGSVALASCLVSPLMAFKSAEYYATHNEERKRVLKKCDDLAVSALQQGRDLSKEQKSMCGNAERGQRLYSERLRTQRAKVANQQLKNTIQTLAKCYTKMANGLETGVDYLKGDKTCSKLVKRSVFSINSMDALPRLGWAKKGGVSGEDILTDRTSGKYDNARTRHNVLIRCYKTFSNNLTKNGSYQPLGISFHSECRDAISKEFNHPLINFQDTYLLEH